MNNTTQNKLADLFAKRFEDYNTKVLEELAKVIKQFNGLTYTQASKLAQQLKYDKSYIDLVDELSKLTSKSKKEIKKVLEETVKQHTEFADTFFKARNMKTPVYENDTYLKELVNSVANVSEGDFVNLAKSTGFAFLDKKNHIQFLNMKDTYYKVIDDCVYAVSEGKATYGESIRKIIKQLSDSGVRRIVYVNDGKKQYTQRIDTAVRRNVLDSIREVSIESQKEFGKRFRADGVEITVHENPAPDHMNVQGHQFRNEEFDKFQNDEDCEDVNGIKFPATSEETGRDRRSIGQYNCYHTVFSIIVGVSQPLYSDEELEKIKERANEKINIDGKEYTRYEATQLQREIETQIRYAKDRHIMYKEVNDKEGMLDEQLRITQLTRKYKEISNKAELREQLKQRASVSGYKPIRIKNINISDENIIDRLSKYNINVSEKLLDKEMNKGLVDRTLNQVENLVNKYPVLKNKIKEDGLKITTEYMPYAGDTNQLGDELTFSEGLYKNKEKLLQLIKEGQDDNWSAKVNKKNYDIYTPTHETGHILEDAIIRERLKAKKINIDKVYSESRYNASIYRNQQDTDIFNEIFIPVSKKMEIEYTELEKKYISDYGRSEQHFEWFAELFTKMELGEEDIMTKRLKEYLEKELWKK